MAAVLTAACCGGAPVDWQIPEADLRIPLTVEGDLYSREAARAETTINFNEIVPPGRVLADGSLVLTAEASRDPIPLDLAQDAEVRYASGNPILQLRWATGALAPFERRACHLYLKTVPLGHENAWQPIDQTYVPRRGNVLFETGFEIADAKRPDRPEFMHPGGRDKEGETTDRSWTDEEAHSGTHALKIARTTPDEHLPKNSNRPFWWSWPPPMTIAPTQILEFSAWVKAPRLGDNSMASVALECRDAQNHRITDGRLWMRAPRIPHDWVQLKGSIAAPAESAGAVVWFSLHGTGEAYCDDVRVSTVRGAQLPDLRVDVDMPQLRSEATAAQEAAAGRHELTAVCTATDVPPVIDGTLDDTCWQEAGRVDSLTPHARVPGTDVPTVIRLCADPDALYIAFECWEPDTADLHANASERDGRLWEDDSVEIFLDTNRDLHTYYQIIINSRGVIFDQDTGAPGLPGPGWDGPVTAAARVLPDRWTAELKLAFNGLRLADAEGGTWGANFARTSLRGGRSLYVWAPVRKNFGEPALFGRLILPFDPGANVVGGRPLAGDTAYCGAGTLPFEVVNRRPAPAGVTVSATLKSAAGDRTLGTAETTVPPHETLTAAIPAVFSEPGAARVVYALTETGSGELLYSTSVVHTVPPRLTVEPETLVSYSNEPCLHGHWTLGLHPDALNGITLVLAVTDVAGDAQRSRSEIAPADTAGAYALDVTGLPPGRYRINATLLTADKTLDTVDLTFERIPGPLTGFLSGP
jgi:hypothetical protein